MKNEAGKTDTAVIEQERKNLPRKKIYQELLGE